MTLPAICRSLALAAIVILASRATFAGQPPERSAADEPLPPAAQLTLSEILEVHSQIQPRSSLPLTDSPESQRIFSEALANAFRQAAQSPGQAPSSHPEPTPLPTPGPSFLGPPGVLPSPAVPPGSSGEADYADRRPPAELLPPNEPWLEQVPAVLTPHTPRTGHALPSAEPQAGERPSGREMSGREMMDAAMVESLRQTSSQLDQLANQLERERRYHDADQLRQLAQRLRAEARERDPNPPIEAGPVVPLSFGPHALRQPTPPPDGTYPAVYPASASHD